MPIVTLQNGLRINFSTVPEAADVQHVVEQVHTQAPSNSFLDGIVSKYFSSHVSYSADQKVPQQYDVRGVKVTESDLKELTNILMGEVGNRDPSKIALEAKTIINTAINRVNEYASRGTLKTLSDVLHEPNQYQGYAPQGVRGSDGLMKPSQYQLAATGKLDATSQPKFQQIQSAVSALKSGSFQDNTNGAFYYAHDPATGTIKYDDTRPLFKQ